MSHVTNHPKLCDQIFTDSAQWKILFRYVHTMRPRGKPNRLKVPIHICENVDQNSIPKLIQYNLLCTEL